MLVTLGQINTTPGDFTGNFNAIIRGIDKARADGSRMVVFPELSIPGYLTCDYMFEKQYVERCRAVLHDIISYTKNYPNLYVVVGYIGKNNTGSGKPFANLLAVLNNGTLIGKYQKQLLPFYDVFDEGRYYEPGNRLLVLEIDKLKVGFTICEDLWNDKGSDNYNYQNNPIESYRNLNIDLMVNISSSPYSKGKPEMRIKMLQKITYNDDRDKIFDLIYVNQIGGQDELVFDGSSCVIKSGQEHTIMSYEKFERNDQGDSSGIPSQYKTVDLSTGCRYVPSPQNKWTHLNMTLMGLYDYANKSGFNRFVIGSSGGIDSALVISLAAIAFGPENIHAIRMPSKWSSDHSLSDARQLHENLGVHDYVVPIDHDDWLHKINTHLEFEQADSVESDDHRETPPNKTYQKLVEYNSVADQNIQARMRGQVIMHFSNARGALALTTGNKTELALGYTTLYGDMSGGFNPIGDLYKLEVYEMAKLINEYLKSEVIPTSILHKAPSAELAPNQTDEDSLLPYPVLDPIVSAYIEDYISTWSEFKEWVDELLVYDDMLSIWIQNDSNQKDYEDMIHRIDLVEFKRRQAAPCTRLTRKSFGTGRRLPIVKHYKRI